MAKLAASIDPAALASYEQLVATRPGVERKGATMPYTSHGGHMFSFMTADGSLALRLPADALQVFLTKYRTRLCEQHGAVMKEYALVPATLLRRTAELAPHFAQSHDYVAGLPAKPTMRGKPSAKKQAVKKKAAKKKAVKKKAVKKKAAKKTSRKA